MKQYQDYKKQFPKIFTGILFIIFTFTPVYFSLAQTASEIRDKIDQKDADIEVLEKEIATYQSQLNTLGQQKNSLSVSIKELDLTRKKLNADISVTQAKIDRTNLKIQTLSSDIGNKENAIANSRDSIATGIRETYELEQDNVVGTLLSETDFTEVWNEVDHIVTLRSTLLDNIDKLRQVKGQLEDTRTETIAAKTELTNLKTKLADQQKIIVQNVNEKNQLLKLTQNSEANYQTLLQNGIAKKNALEQEISDYESQLKFILDPKTLPKKGSLSFPLDSILVTSPFGQRPGEFHWGTDFRAPVGTPVKAMADGVVLGAGNTDLNCYRASFGNWIFIQYNDGLSSTYGHLSLIKVAKGQAVKRGEIVGYSGNTGYSTGPHLHVSLYVSKNADGSPAVAVNSFPSKACPGQTLTQPLAAHQAYLDPMTYLPGV